MPLALAQPNGQAEPLMHINAKKKERESTTRSGIQPCSKAICRKKRVNLPLEVAVR